MPLCRNSFILASPNTRTRPPDKNKSLREAGAQYGTRWVIAAATRNRDQPIGSAGGTYVNNAAFSIFGGSKPTTIPSNRSNSYRDLSNIFGTITGTAIGDDVQYQIHGLFTILTSANVLSPGADGTTRTHYLSDANQLEWDIRQSLIDSWSGETNVNTSITDTSPQSTTSGSGSKSENTTPDVASGLVPTRNR
ncbi:uncharacterized protein BP01DRAFT_365064 [Aspergillus saccharolyticus JOP 1030-1]|uniref:Uncharacterized protein n=1 Tax=Aspergillus saccharolyticus JOP 1030-1 TaxID=1450539 RepID=A0A318ZFJ4_9EURO|nr:hypothetical protein BP01DRAFT_365064 [Aspergillus saccharolyticus JOP 1030-1]PYH46316.1 hypothetical protein BP01DRAFT_365064 [Aspergillus saccharolyticus JOP 1030-1]